MNKTARKRVVQVFLVLSIAVPGAHSSAEDSAECLNCSTATDQELGGLRGGYVAGEGMEILIGIKDYVLLNGALQVSNTLNLPPLGTGAGQVSSDQVLDKMVTVQKYGEGNDISSGVLNNLQSGNFTFIQNSLDHAVIRKVTEISATVTVLDTFRQLSLRSMMTQQLVNAAK